MKKQIVFIEDTPTIPVFKLARTLKLTKKYETVLISFSRLNKEFYSKAFDKIIIFEIGDIRRLKNLLFIFRQIFGKNRRKFLDEIRKLNPYIVQFTGADIWTMTAMACLFRKYPRVYFAHDTWEFYGKKLSFKKNSGTMIYFNSWIEKYCFKNADGILHKGLENELSLLTYKDEIKAPDMAFFPFCLDEWIYPVKKKFNKEFNVVYVGGYWKKWEGHVSFFEVIDILTSQKIHFHIYSLNEKENDEEMRQLEKGNKYFHLHAKERAEDLDRIISKYDFGIIPDFLDESLKDKLLFKITLSNKTFNYIEAGLPTIASEQLEFICKILEDNKIGMGIKFEDLKNLNNILKKIDSKKILGNIRESQKKFSFNKNIDKFEKFFDKVHQNKKTKCNPK